MFGRDPLSFVHGQNAGDVGISLGFSAIDVGKRLAVSVLDLIAAWYLLNRPRRREAAGALLGHSETPGNSPRGAAISATNERKYREAPADGGTHRGFGAPIGGTCDFGAPIGGTCDGEGNPSLEFF